MMETKSRTSWGPRRFRGGANSHEQNGSFLAHGECLEKMGSPRLSFLISCEIFHWWAAMLRSTVGVARIYEVARFARKLARLPELSEEMRGRPIKNIGPVCISPPQA